MTRAVLFDYGLTLVTFRYPRAELLAVLERVRPWLGPGAPPAEALMSDVLETLEADLEALGEDEVDYLDLYDRAWRRAGLTVPRTTLWRILDLEQRCWDETLELAPGVLQTLDELRARHIKTAIASNAPFPPPMMHRQVRHHGLAQRVDAVVFSSEIGRRKPAPELYRAGLQRLEVAAGDAIYVGDRLLEDYEGPRRIGMRAVLCTALARTRPPADVPVIGQLTELLDCVP